MDEVDQAQYCAEALRRLGVGLGHDAGDWDRDSLAFTCLLAPLTADDLLKGKSGGAPLAVGGSAARLWRALYELVLAVGSGSGSGTNTAAVHIEHRAAAIGCAWRSALAAEEAREGGEAGNGSGASVASGMPSVCAAVLGRAVEALEHLQ